jgi:hypothetical protein
MSDKPIVVTIRSGSFGEIRSATGGSASEADWVTKMHQHFVRTGTYRASDLERVLGDPRVSVEISAQEEIQVAGIASKK